MELTKRLVPQLVPQILLVLIISVISDAFQCLPTEQEVCVF